MSYSLTFGADLEGSIRRVAREQLEGAAARLRDGHAGDPVEAVHDARKHLKKTRSLLRLARPAMPSSEFRRVNRALRDRGRALSGTRDADVMVATVDALAERFAGHLPASAFEHVRRPLAERAAGQREDAAAAMAEHAEALRALAAEADGWPLDGALAAAVAKARARSYAQARRAFRRAEREPTSANLHEWRKRAKDLWYHERLLRASWPGVMRAQAKETRELTQLLGENHDLAVLAQSLRDEPALTRSPAADVDAILQLVEHRRAELLAAARALAERIFAEPRKAHARRVGRYVELADGEAYAEPAAAPGI
jgi:CHAD domain-containing protein